MSHLIFLVFAFSVSLGNIFQQKEWHNHNANAPETWQKEMLDLTNEIRKNSCQCGSDKMPAQKALKWNDVLAKAAQKHAEDMYKNNFIGHNGSNGSRIGQRVERAGYHWKSVAENVAWNIRTVKGAMSSWKNSPGHCQNIMGGYTEMGAAKAGQYWVQVFARPSNR